WNTSAGYPRLAWTRRVNCTYVRSGARTSSTAGYGRWDPGHLQAPPGGLLSPNLSGPAVECRGLDGPAPEQKLPMPLATAKDRPIKPAAHFRRWPLPSPGRWSPLILRWVAGAMLVTAACLKAYRLLFYYVP